MDWINASHPNASRAFPAATEIPPETLALARRLHACETVAGETSTPAGAVTLRVYEKLRRHLGALAGAAAFQSLASRALTLARAEAPGLSAAQVAVDGRLQGLGEPDVNIDRDQAEAGGVIFIARFLGLLLTFIGEALTVRLLQNAWPDADFEGRQPLRGEKS
jgi:hypothetical protein